MSSVYLENLSRMTNRAADRFLVLLKMRGPQSSAELGSALGITDEAARQQVLKLAAEGLVEGVSEASGVGRPTQKWRLTKTGNARFPDAHAELTVQLIQSIRTEWGETALDRLIAAREQETRKNYAQEMAGAADLRERVARLAAIRSREGYMAEWKEEGEGYLLIENHCPICAAAAICQGFCRAELAVFQETLGPEAQVTRVEHIPAGARRCAYQITRINSTQENKPRNP
jgi:predicted ArsR family transcriptional regulator